MTLMVRMVRLPWEASVEVDPTLTWLQGSLLSAANNFGRFALTVNT